MPRKSTPKVQEVLVEEEVESKGSRSKRQVKAKVVPTPSPSRPAGRSRRSSTAAQTAASEAESRTTIQRRGRHSSSASSESANRSRDVSEERPRSRGNSRRATKKVNYVESDGDETAAKNDPDVQEEDYKSDEDVESDSGDSLNQRKGKTKSTPSPVRSRTRTPAKRNRRNQRSGGRSSGRSPRSSGRRKKSQESEEEEEEMEAELEEAATPKPEGRSRRRRYTEPNTDESEEDGGSKNNAEAIVKAPASTRASRAAKRRDEISQAPASVEPPRRGRATRGRAQKSAVETEENQLEESKETTENREGNKRKNEDELDGGISKKPKINDEVPEEEKKDEKIDEEEPMEIDEADAGLLKSEKPIKSDSVKATVDLEPKTEDEVDKSNVKSPVKDLMPQKVSPLKKEEKAEMLEKESHPIDAKQISQSIKIDQRPAIVEENQPKTVEQTFPRVLELASPSKKPDQIPPKIEQTPKTSQSPTKVEQIPPKVAEISPKLVQIPPKVVATPPKVVATPPKAMETSPKIVTTPAKVVTTPPKIVQAPPKIAQTLPKVVQTPPKVEQTSTLVAQTPPKKPEDMQPKKVEHALQKVTPKTIEQVPPKTMVQTPPKITAQTPPKTMAQTPPKTMVQTPPKTMAQTPSKTMAQTLPKTIEQVSPKKIELTSMNPVETPPKKPQETHPKKPEEMIPKKPVETPPKKPEEILPKKSEETSPKKPEHIPPKISEQTPPKKPEETPTKTTEKKTVELSPSFKKNIPEAPKKEIEATQSLKKPESSQLKLPEGNEKQNVLHDTNVHVGSLQSSATKSDPLLKTLETSKVSNGMNLETSDTNEDKISDNVTNSELSKKPSSNDSSSLTKTINDTMKVNGLNDLKAIEVHPVFKGRKYLLNKEFSEDVCLNKTFGVVCYNLAGEAPKPLENFVSSIKALNSDLICMQGVGEVFYSGYLLSNMEVLGYKSLYFKPDSLNSGFCTFYKGTVFNLKNQKEVSLEQAIKKEVETNVVPEERQSVVTNINASGFGLLAHLDFVNNFDKPTSLAVANLMVPSTDLSTHALQMSCLAREATSFLSGSNDPLVMCGSFHMQETEASYQLLRDGNLSNEMIDTLKRRKDIKIPGKEENTALVNLLGKSFQHSNAGLRSCYASVLGKELPSKVTPEMIWFSSNQLQTVGVLDAMDERKFLDQSLQSSTHLILKADLALSN